MPSKKKETTLCLECSEAAIWVRDTQFSGRHPYCDKHARLEPDFGKKNDSYRVWKKLDRERRC